MARAPIRGKINRAKSGARYRVLPVTRVRLSFIGVQKEEGIGYDYDTVNGEIGG